MLLSASLIHDGHGFLPQGSVIEADDSGSILGIHARAENPEEVWHFEGILCPGFVNAHCHLELSHLKGMMPEGTGLIPFLQKVPLYRSQFTSEQIKAARHEAYQELLANGVVAVGDIANQADTLDLRALDQIHFHSFIECIGFTEQHAAARFRSSVDIHREFAGQAEKSRILRQSIVPHAPYSVSPAVFRMIDGFESRSRLSIHNQESPEEDRYYKTKEGGVKTLLDGFGIDDGFFETTGKSSLRSYIDWIGGAHPAILVHNTYTAREDILAAKEHFAELYWCLCPNANIYIENRLPDVDLLTKSGAAICIGTDSLASNHRLCVLSELNTLKEKLPHLRWEELLSWATINGARALGMQERIGSFEKGKTPGILHITDPSISPGRAGIETPELVSPTVKRIV